MKIFGKSAMRSTLILDCVFLLALLLGRSAFSAAFPSQCTWTANDNFICNKGGLTRVPNIPKSAFTIDLSNNINLRFKEDYFLRFKKLKTLVLNNCGLHDNPVLLPPSIRTIKLNNNILTDYAIRKTFENSSRIGTIHLANNKLMIDRILKFLPVGANFLSLEGNSLPKMHRESFSRFPNLSILYLSSCGVNEIASGALKSASKLQRLYLNRNNLKSLPEDLFLHIKRLKKLQFSDNKFTRVPNLKGLTQLQYLYAERNEISKIHYKDLYGILIKSIHLAQNRIESFDLSHTRYLKLDLSFNKIKRLPALAFRNASKLYHLMLQNNSISYVSPLAFKNLTEIGRLCLHKNSIKSLPEDVFKNMSIGTLFLYGNKIETMRGVIDQMSIPPSTLLLFSNPMLKIFRARDFAKMANGSKIYITCNDLIHFNADFAIEASIECLPSVNLSIQTSDASLRRDGFKCEKLPSHIFECTPCPPGHYAYLPRGPCRRCPAGSFYQDELGLNYCKSCPSGQYVPPNEAPGKSPLACLTCPDGTKKNLSAGYRACSCLPGFARRDRFGKCSKCSKAGLDCQRDYPILEGGYWWRWHNKSHLNLTCQQSFSRFIDNLDTTEDSYNFETSTFHCQLPEPHQCPIKGACLGGIGAPCRKGYTGVLCSVCQTGYSRSLQKCIKCPSPLEAGLKFVGYIAAFFVVCGVISWADKIRLAEDNDGCSRTFADVLLSNLKILLGFYQVLVSIFRVFSSFDWPSSLKKAIGTFEMIQLQVFSIPSLNCIRPDWGLDVIDEFWIALIGTAGVPVVILAYFVTKKTYLYLSIVLPQEYVKRRKDCKKNCLRVLMLFLFVTYPLTSQKIVQLLPVGCHVMCTLVDNKGACLHQLSYLRADYSVKCLSTNDWTLVVAYIALIIPLGLPLVIFFLLHKFAETSSNEEEHLQLFPFENNSSREEGEMKFALKFLFENYNSSNRFWEALELIRKLVMTAGVSLFVGHYKIGINVTIMVAFIFAILHAYRHPIKNKFENTLQLLSLSILPVNLCLAAVLQSSVYSPYIQQKMDDLIIGYTLISLNLLVFVLVCMRLLPKFLAVLWKFLKALCSFCRCKMSSCCNCDSYPTNSDKDLLLN